MKQVFSICEKLFLEVDRMGMWYEFMYVFDYELEVDFRYSYKVGYICECFGKFSRNFIFLYCLGFD